jgi:hypothetical protein
MNCYILRDCLVQFDDPNRILKKVNELHPENGEQHFNLKRFYYTFIYVYKCVDLETHIIRKLMSEYACEQMKLHDLNLGTHNIKKLMSTHRSEQMKLYDLTNKYRNY